MPAEANRRISWNDLPREPFRFFFPAGVAASILGVSVWPLYFWGVLPSYPGPNHARIMAHGFFGAFIFGFLGTALPRMLSSRPLNPIALAAVFIFYAASVAANFLGRTAPADALWLTAVVVFVGAAFLRFRKRSDLPPPGFVLVALAFLSVIVGAVLALALRNNEEAFFWMMLGRLLYFQGFVLLPILGVGGFILPRLLGVPSRQDFPESYAPPPGWSGKALTASAVGVLLISSFVLEASGWIRTGYLLRLLVVSGYLLTDVRLFRAPSKTNVLALSLKIAVALLLLGLLSVAKFPGYRVGLLHLTLIGGFGVITLSVAIRVVFGHSGNLSRLSGKNRWFIVAIGLMLFGMATRVSGDFWPKIMATHYSYGALVWACGVLIWAAYVLPKVFFSEPE